MTLGDTRPPPKHRGKEGLQPHPGPARRLRGARHSPVRAPGTQPPALAAPCRSAQPAAAPVGHVHPPRLPPSAGPGADSREYEEEGAGANQQRSGRGHRDVLGGFEARPGAAGHPGRRAAASLPGAGRAGPAGSGRGRARGLDAAQDPRQRQRRKSHPTGGGGALMSARPLRWTRRRGRAEGGAPGGRLLLRASPPLHARAATSVLAGPWEAWVFLLAAAGPSLRSRLGLCAPQAPSRGRLKVPWQSLGCGGRLR